MGLYGSTPGVRCAVITFSSEGVGCNLFLLKIVRNAKFLRLRKYVILDV